MNDLKLCYIRDNFAYFTAKDLNKQWGDDWDDAPYEHNAGLPYKEPYFDIERVAFDVDLCLPAGVYSVDDINSGQVPWLDSCDGDMENAIYAGISMKEFIQKIEDFGGEVFLKKSLSL